MDFLITNFKQTILSVGALRISWLALSILVCFLIAKFLFTRFYGKANKPFSIDIYLLSLVFISVLSARWGWSLTHTNLIEQKSWWLYILPFHINHFRFTSYQELSIPGGLIGLILAVWFLHKKFTSDNFTNALRRTLFISCVCGSILMLANFFHSYFLGKATDSNFATVSMGKITTGLQKLNCCIMRNPDGPNPLKSVTGSKSKSQVFKVPGDKSIVLQLQFKDGIEEREATEFIIGDVKSYLYENSIFVKEPGDQPIKYSLSKSPSGHIIGSVSCIAIARHPVSLYFVCFLLFLLLFGYVLNQLNVKQNWATSLMLILFSIFYFLLEPYVLQPSNQLLIASLLPNQWITLFLGIVSLGFLFIPFSKKSS